MLWFDQENCIDHKIANPFGPLIYHNQVGEGFLRLLQSTAENSRTSEDRGATLAGNIASQQQAVVEQMPFMEHLYPHVLHYVRSCYNRLETNLIGVTPKQIDSIKLHLGDGPWINYQ